jgi:alpha-D-ribose 1-methylphosphonate 5-triphosphate synthase subunit PhnL
MLDVQNVCKTFTLHNQGGTHIAVFNNLSLQVRAGECVALSGRSGAGKSTLLRSLYANYKPTAGSISVLHRGTMVDIVPAPPRKVLEIRKYTIGYVSQFLRVIPRVTALDIVAAARKEVTGHTAEARKQAFRADCGTSHPPRFPAANSSALTSHGDLPCPTPCCCWTSPRHRWTAPTSR